MSFANGTGTAAPSGLSDLSRAKNAHQGRTIRYNFDQNRRRQTKRTRVIHVCDRCDGNAHGHILRSKQYACWSTVWSDR